MSLWFDLHANTQLLGSVEIRRLQKADLQDPYTSETRFDYDVSLDGRVLGQVWHIYGEGPWVLVEKAMGLVKQHWVPGP